MHDRGDLRPRQPPQQHGAAAEQRDLYGEPRVVRQPSAGSRRDERLQTPMAATGDTGESADPEPLGIAYTVGEAAAGGLPVRSTGPG